MKNKNKNKDIQLRCIWCIRDTKTKPCEHCGSDQVYNKNKFHTPHWSRLTIKTVECKQCGKVISMEDYLSGKHNGTNH